MKPKHVMLLIGVSFVVLYFLTRDAEKKSGIVARPERITVVTSRDNSQDFQPDMESYRSEKEQMAAAASLGDAKSLGTPEYRSSNPLSKAPEYRYSKLRGKIPGGPVDNFGAPVFMPSETAMTDQKIYEQEYAKHRERFEAYTSARMEEMQMNTTAEKEQMRATIDLAKSKGTKSPEEIKRAEDAYARMEALEKVLKGEKLQKIPD